ncbi:MAG: FAD-binding oxidoreductase [Deltaproteobacteria bacterium]|nr:FAD-binding oxidoreductase [Deltaproteobacteria bacterium]
MNTRYHSWGRFPRIDQSALRLAWRSQPLPIPSDAQTTYLPFGNGRSYGDVCLNAGGWLLDTRGLDRFMAFDPVDGVLRCEGGVLLDEILSLSVPRGWFPPVVPGTRFVTVGGAIASDVHGKNHHSAGTFGCHVRRLELLRSDGQRLICSPTENPRWFRATIGGLGLTGLILWAEIQLKRIDSAVMDVETIRYGRLDEFFELTAQSDRQYEYTVAWIDCMAIGNHLGRGLFIRGNHAAPGVTPVAAPRGRMTIPVDLPISLINRSSARAFNSFFYHKQARARSAGREHYEAFFFPLDGIGHWNRLYGPRGFLQYQCVLPLTGGRDALREILDRGAHGGIDSFLGVLKVFGDHPSPGLLSFPRPGITVALDFYHHGETTLRLLDDFDALVSTAGGAVYPSKDARMAGASFRTYFPRWRELEHYRDPAFSSSFWRRVTGG